MNGAYLAVARLRKPHGLKGEAVVWVLTDEPDAVLAPGKTLTPLADSGQPCGTPVVIERSRPYQRQWLVKFRGIADRTTVERWRQRVFGVPSSELSPPAEDEMYAHEVPGALVVAQGRELGVAVGLVDVPGGELLAVEIDGREVLLPFRKPIVQRIDRSARRIEVDPPPGLLEL
ncbi:MAG: ribosome maturation factor RimM [Gemmatimonadales bacterium]